MTTSNTQTAAFDFQANDRLGDALVIASTSVIAGVKRAGNPIMLPRSERGWCVLWAMAGGSYEVLRQGLEALRDGGTLDYENRKIVCRLAASPAIQL